MHAAHTQIWFHDFSRAFTCILFIESEPAAGYFYRCHNWISHSVSQVALAGSMQKEWESLRTWLWLLMPSATLPSWLISPGFKLMCVTNPASRPASLDETLCTRGARQLALWKRMHIKVLDDWRVWPGGCSTQLFLHHLFRGSCF